MKEKRDIVVCLDGGNPDKFPEAYIEAGIYKKDVLKEEIEIKEVSQHMDKIKNRVNEVVPDSIKEYIDGRRNLRYYTYLKSFLMTICREDDSILDVGSRGIDMLSFLPCKRKKSIDLQYPYSDENTEGITGDYLDYHPEGLDIITCFQVLEHIGDNQVGVFAKKLLSDARIAIVSLPYMWPKTKCKWHVQDPVDVDKITSWFGRNPVFIQIIKEKDNESRIVLVFIEGCNPDIDLDYWREDARKTAKNLKWKLESNQILTRLLSKLRKS